MARGFIVSDSSGVHILIISLSLVFWTSYGEISKKDQYIYKSDGTELLKETDPLDFKLLDVLYSVQKRDVQQTNVRPVLQRQQQLVPQQDRAMNETETDFLKRENRKPTNMMNKMLLGLNFTKAVPFDFHRRNLGENGSGIYWNSTAKPFVPTPMEVPIDSNAIENATFDSNLDDMSLDKMFDVVTSFDKHVTENNYFVNNSDTHLYYNSTFTTAPDIGRSIWVEFANSSLATTHELLSTSHRRAATVKLSFEFPFYGHLIRNVTVATGGFIFTGEYVHSWLAATQYIAPLMANFDTSLSNESCVKYIDNGTAFTVQWEKVALQEKPDKGQFTFQTTLHENGDIVFAYQNVPDIIKSIGDDYHPVTIGVSDAYIIDHSEDYVRRKTIFEYHKVSFKKENIKNWTVIYLTPLPTCLGFSDCHSCISTEIPSFKCSWCPITRRCSIGLDRYRHDWLVSGCDRKQIRDPSLCQSLYTSEVDYNEVILNDRSSIRGTALASRSVGVKQDVDIGASGLVAALFLGALLIVMGLWLFYAYRYPHSTSGQILIRYRPSQWRWKRGEARYTAATIHM